MNKSTNICNNCGKQGHMFNQCKLPIISYGIIVFKSSPQGIKFLMIRRKDSFGYIDFIRGKYSLNNLQQIKNIINEMSIDEKNRLLTLPFDILWNEMWGNPSNINIQYKSEEINSKKKFELLKEGISINSDGTIINLKDIIDSSVTSWTETEWEFPKGRRNQKEKDLECALREFEEETGIAKSDLVLVENILPFEEMFIGSNHKSYKHKYFLALMDEKCNTLPNNLNNYQKTEVSKLEWKTFNECLECIRPYNLEKKELIININKVLQEYRLYS
jgi:8-oxo-dGTP pyrophosphatase MutT (NUDIX family)